MARWFHILVIPILLIGTPAFEAPRTVHLDPFDTGAKFAEAGDIVDSGILGPCIVVIFYDPATKSMVGRHLLPTYFGLKSAIAAARERFGSLEKLEVYLTGARGFAFLPLFSESDYEDARKKALEEMQEIFVERQRVYAEIVEAGVDPEKVTVAWLPAQTRGVLTFDPAQGDAILEIQDALRDGARVIKRNHLDHFITIPEGPRCNEILLLDF